MLVAEAAKPADSQVKWPQVEEQKQEEVKVE